MAEKKSGTGNETGGNGGLGGGAAIPGGQAAQDGVQVAMIAQYVRDLSFENPGAPASIRQMQQKKPSININVQVNARNAGEEGYEVSLVINAEAKIDDKAAFIIELDYGALFGVRNLSEEQLEQFLLVECPGLMFPFARRILADVSRDGGYMPLLIDPIDFSALYHHYKSRGEAEIKPN